MFLKNKLLILPFSLIFFSVLGQDHISMSYNSTESGRNMIIGYSKSINSINELGFGLRININSITQPDDQSNFYYKRLYATEFYQFFGVNIFYHRSIFNKWQCVKPYLFYDLQVTYSTTRSSMYVPTYEDAEGNILYRNFIEYFGPFLWIDQNIGIGCKVKLFKSMYLFENFGVGMTFIIGEENQIMFREKFACELGGILSLGILYRFNE